MRPARHGGRARTETANDRAAPRIIPFSALMPLSSFCIVPKFLRPPQPPLYFPSADFALPPPRSSVMPGHASPIPFPSYMVSSRQQTRRGSGAANSETYPLPTTGVVWRECGWWRHLTSRTCTHANTILETVIFAQNRGEPAGFGRAASWFTAFRKHLPEKKHNKHTHIHRAHRSIHRCVHPFPFFVCPVPITRPNQSLVAHTPSLSDRCSSSVPQLFTPAHWNTSSAHEALFAFVPRVHLCTSVMSRFGSDCSPRGGLRLRVRSRSRPLPRARDRMISQAPCCATH
jgi:hypothetical protein